MDIPPEIVLRVVIKPKVSYIDDVFAGNLVMEMLGTCKDRHADGKFLVRHRARACFCPLCEARSFALSAA